MADLVVGVPCKNEELSLHATLTALERQVVASAAVRFLVIDDGSTDRTRAIAAEFAARDPRFAVHSFEKNQGKTVALSWFFRTVAKEYAITLDADLALQGNGVLESVVVRLQRGADVVGGSPYPLAPRSWPERGPRFSEIVQHRCGSRSVGRPSTRVTAGCWATVRR